MDIVSWNVNGLRAVERKGALVECVERTKPSILLLQEIKGNTEQFSDDLIEPKGYQAHYYSSLKAGYSGVGIWVSDEITDFSIEEGIPGWDTLNNDDKAGRVLRVDIETISILSVYVPNGGKSEDAFKEKLKFYKALSEYADEIIKSGKICIIGGDYNVAHTDIDLAQPERHKEGVCASPPVRKEFSKLLTKFTDTFRHLNPNAEGVYSYWDNFDRTLRGVPPREINRGMRLDYFLVNKEAQDVVSSAKVHQDVLGSDHCPVSISLS